MLLELLGLVLVEFARERLGDGWYCEKAHDTEWLWSNEQLAHAVCCLSSSPKKEQLALTHVNYYCYS